MRLSNKGAVITGGAAGKLDASDRALGVVTDVSDAVSVRAMVEAAVARFGRIDVLVNNAALFAPLTPRPFDEIPEAEWDRVMAVNVRGVWNCARAVAPVMRTQGSGRIINVASAIVAKGTALLTTTLRRRPISECLRQRASARGQALEDLQGFRHVANLDVR